MTLLLLQRVEISLTPSVFGRRWQVFGGGGGSSPYSDDATIYMIIYTHYSLLLLLTSR